MKKWIALLLTLAMLLSLVPTVFAAAPKAEEPPRDIWEIISEIEDSADQKAHTASLAGRTAAYSAKVDEIIDAVTSSSSYVPGTLERHGNFFFWVDADGNPNGYSPSLRARLRSGAVPGADPMDYAATEVVSYASKGGSPDSMNIAAFQPYIGIDSSFTNQYELRCNSIAQALGGVGTTYKTSNANINNIALALSTCGVVIFDSHGTTDYEGGTYYNPDYTSQANSSYLCLTTSTGITEADKAPVQGTFGTYYHAFNGGGTWCIDGTAMANHMTTDSPNSLLWMAICLGMATDGLQAPLREKGMEVVYGYSQSVTFAGDYAWEGKFWPKMIEGDNVKTAIAYMKQQVGIKDPYENTKPAWPIVASSEDVYPGQGNVDKAQTVNSTWTLYPQYTLTAVSNNTEWGTVSVRGKSVIAIPKDGYYAADYELLAGTATVTRDGNTFNVEPESDCTIRINFAPRDPATIHFSCPEGVSCAEMSAFVGDEITLPAPEGAPTADGHPYRLLGWTLSATEDTTAMPAFYKVGSKVKLEQTDVTFYALYSYFQAENGISDDQFMKVTEAPASWTGEYVLTYDGTLALDASGNVKGSNIGTSKAVVDLAAMGCVKDEVSLNGVTEDLIFEAVPSENGTYNLKMKDRNLYLAMASDTNSLTTYTSATTDKTRWTLSYGANGPVITSVAYPARTLQYNVSSNLFRCYTTPQKPLTLYAKADGETWYTTNLKNKTSCETHVFGDWIVDLEPTCTENGNRYHICTVCGARENETVAALGHEPGEAVKENEIAATCTEAGGYDLVVSCTRCGEELSRTHTEVPAPGHAWDAGVVTKEPTEQAEGEMTFTCTRCGETRTEVLPMLTHNCPCAAFEDMPPYGTPEHEAIDWAYTHQPIPITTGMNDTAFGVGKTLTRGQAATFLYAAAGRPEFDESTAAKTFSDVPEGKYYTKAVLWAASEGLVDGYSDGTFKPNNTLTRAQILTILYAQAGKPAVDEYTNPYSDVRTGNWYYAPAVWAYSAGIEKGADGKFAQATLCTREAFVLYLYRVMEGKALAE